MKRGRYKRIVLILAAAMILIGGMGWKQKVTWAAERTKKEVSLPAGSDSQALQELLNLNKEGAYALTIQIPAGEYELKGELKIYSNTTIIADEKAVLTKTHKHGSLLANELSKDKGGFSASENITIIGGVWDSAPVADDKKGTESFRFIHAQNITIKNAVVCNVPESSHLITFAGVKHGIIEGCTLYGYHGTRPKEAIQIDIVHDNVVVPSMQEDFIVYDDQACEDIQILNNEIYDFPRAIGSHTSVKGVYHQGIVISENKMHDLLEAAIKAYNYKDCEFSKNTITKAGLGILVYTGIDNEEEHYFEPLAKTKTQDLPENYNIVIRENEFSEILVVKEKKVTAWGDGIRVLGSKDRPMSGVTIEQNTFQKIGRYGIFAEEAPSCQVNNNQISNADQNGIYLINGCDDSNVLENTIENTSDGIGLLASKNITVSKNKISTPRVNGIFVFDSCTNSTISSNQINTPKENGIAVYQQSNDCTVTKNTISNYKKHGIFFYEVGSGTITSNKVSVKANAASQDGIHIVKDTSSKNSFSVKKNTISRAGRYGIYLSKAKKSQVASNKISNTNDHALYFDQGSDGSKVTSNQITNAGKKKSSNGIEINHSVKVTISKNTIKNAARNGVFIYNESKNCTVSSNIISAAGENGISVSNKSSAATVTANQITGSTIKDSKNRGIFIYESEKAKITKNVITGCQKKQEITISKSDGCTQKDNTIESSK